MTGKQSVFNRLITLVGLMAATLAPAQAEPFEYFLIDGVEYDQSVPIPDDWFGFGLGERAVRHHQMVSYLTAVAEGSDRITVETIGHSHEGRPILFFVVTSPENHARLDDIRAAHLARLETGEAPSEDIPAVLWINYGVHGAESTSMDAAIPALYHLAAAQGEAIEQTLAESVVLITAVYNPDGHARRINHVDTFAGAVPVTDPAHEQHQLWIEARTNHYWFDLNRQWLLLTQPEAQAWVAKWHAWKPYVTADYHEMGSEASYYFHPGEPQRRNPLIPEQARELALAIAGHHAAFFDSEQRLYYAEERFDNFYVGKGSTYPQVNGGVGILFEVGAARGGQIQSASGLRTYADNIRMHFRTTLTTIEGGLANADALEAYQREFFQRASRDAATDDRRAFVFTTAGDAARRHRFVELLLTHDITVHRLGDTITVNEITFDADTSFIVPLNQSQYRMVRGIFDRVTEFEEDVFYDVSGWTLPLAYDLDHATVQGRAFNTGLLGDVVTEAPRPTFAPPPTEAYGYIFDWTEFYAPRALHRLLREDVFARIATTPATLPTADGEVTVGRGAVFVPLSLQTTARSDIDAIIAAIAAEDGVEVHAVTSGFSQQAGADVGGPSFEPVQAPSVLVVFDDGVSYYDAGEVWHMLDYHMHMPITLRRKDELVGLDWSRYTHLIMPGGGNVALPEPVLPRVRQWVNEGGTVIALRQSAAWAQATLMTAPPVMNGAPGDDAPAAMPTTVEETADEAGAPQRFDYAERGLRDAEHVIGGAIVATDLDISHPLGFGYTDRVLPSHRNTTLVLDWPEGDPFAAPAAYVDTDLVLSGYASERRQSEIAGSPMAVAERHGAGTVIMIADNPVFRGTFVGTNKLFLNAIFFSRLIDPARGDYTP